MVTDTHKVRAAVMEALALNKLNTVKFTAKAMPSKVHKGTKVTHVTFESKFMVETAVKLHQDVKRLAYPLPVCITPNAV
jgi:hypothetical protein